MTLVVALPARADPVLLPTLLDVSVNGRAAGVMAVQAQGGHLFVSAADFRKLALSVPAKPDAEGRYDLAAIAGVKAQQDGAEQRLLLTADPALLPRQLYDLAAGNGDVPVARSDTGAIFRYDLSTTAADLSHFGAGLPAGGDFALDVFTPDARITASGFATAGATGWHAARLDSALVFEKPGDMTELVLGDSISGASAFGRAVRFGGVHWGRDFSLRPGLVTQPLPAFSGAAKCPPPSTSIAARRNCTNSRSIRDRSSCATCRC